MSKEFWVFFILISYTCFIKIKKLKQPIIFIFIFLQQNITHRIFGWDDNDVNHVRFPTSLLAQQN
jgi:hypothetical protein